MKIIDQGHVYDLVQLGGGLQRITFVKRSSGVIKHAEEWPGMQTQEVLRAAIDRTKYLNNILPCVESQEALYHLRMALFMYEVRAWRRKQEEVNKKSPSHDDSARPRSWRSLPLEDVPFNEHEIELRVVGVDGHILV